MVALGQMLRRMGADIIATPCVTAHYFHDALQQGIGLPVIHGIDCAVEVLKEAGVTRVGLMATDGTVESGIFQRKLEQANIQTVLPDKVGQVGVMELIYGQVKAGRPADLDLFYGIRDDLRCRGAQGVILGCTELSLLKKQGDLGNGILDVLDVLARKSVQVCGKTVRPEYECLFVPFGEKE
jgi:aspartate racemase